MSRFFPHAAFAEDQPLPKTILTVHVLTRGLTMGTLISSAITSGSQIIPRFRPHPPTAFLPRLVANAATGSVLGVGLSGVALVARMWGRDGIEWNDRSWRLMENKGQLETDDWTYGGMAVAAVGWMVRGMPMGWRGGVGAAGWGSVGGMFGYMAWRHGINGGRFPDGDKEKLL
jgi:hypothetical protein